MSKLGRFAVLALVGLIIAPASVWAVEVIIGERVANDDIPFCGG